MGIVVGVGDDIAKFPVEANSVVEPVGTLVVQMFTRTAPELMVRSDQDVGCNASEWSLGGPSAGSLSTRGMVRLELTVFLIAVGVPFLVGRAEISNTVRDIADASEWRTGDMA
jgi:hypothetical protein